MVDLLDGQNFPILCKRGMRISRAMLKLELKHHWSPSEPSRPTDPPTPTPPPPPPPTRRGRVRDGEVGGGASFKAISYWGPQNPHAQCNPEKEKPCQRTGAGGGGPGGCAPHPPTPLLQGGSCDPRTPPALMGGGGGERGVGEVGGSRVAEW